MYFSNSDTTILVTATKRTITLSFSSDINHYIFALNLSITDVPIVVVSYIFTVLCLCKRLISSFSATTMNKQKGSTPTFTVRRTFTVRNTGQLPFYVHGFSINDLPCEGYGFRILDCSGFQMLPNDSKKVDIA